MSVSKQTITEREALGLMTTSKGKLFSVDFVRRGDGKETSMTCRTGVKPTQNQGSDVHKSKRPKMDYGKHNLMPVYSFDRQGYRSIPVDNIIRIRHNGVTFEVIH